MHILRTLFRILERLYGFVLYRLQLFFVKRAKFDTLEFRLSGKVIESPAPFSFSLRPRSKTISLLTLTNFFKIIEKDPKIKRIIIRLEPLQMGWAQTQTVARALAAIKASGKEIIVYMEQCGNREFFLAAHATKRIAPPGAVVHLVGFLMEAIYFKELLDKFSVEPDFLAMGKYKNAAETFTRKSPSRPSKEMTAGLAEGIYEQLVTGLADALEWDDKSVREIIDNGPYTARDALEKGLIHDCAYYDEMVDALKEKHEKIAKVDGWRYFRAMSYLQANLARLEDRPRLALIYVGGPIVETNSQVGRSQASSRTLCRQIKKIRKDKNVKAVVVRISSPGGSSLASDLIWHQLVHLRKKKPVIVSMGNVAASGGYYIGMAGDEIFVEPGTITGSIGVIAGKFNMKGIYRKFGVYKTQYKQGENAAIFSDYDKFSDSEKQRMQTLIEQFYEDFVQKVAISRGMTEDKAHALAEGRVYLGSEAVENGLADRFGGLTDAVDLAKTKSLIPPDSPARLDIYPRVKNPWLQFLTQQPQAALPEAITGFLEDVSELSALDGSPLYRLPYILRFH